VSFWTRLYQRWSRRPGHAHSPRSRPRAWRPVLELLENRWLPTTFIVANTNDSGAGSLRQAVLDANANPGPDTINFASSLNGGTIVLTSGQLSITDALQINGPGANLLAVSGNANSRVFSNSSNATIVGLAIENGQVDASVGAGAGILNSGNMTLQDCVITHNSVTTSGPVAQGGGIMNTGTLTVFGCTIDNNSANDGGGLNNANILSITDSTIDDNIATDSGAGIWNTGTTGMLSDTVALNFSFAGASGVFAAAGSISYQDSAFSHNIGGNIGFSGGTVVSHGHNISDDGTGNFSVAAGDLPNTDPMLGPLADNGGPTGTNALLFGSPAINAGDASAPPQDQRGVSRVGAADIGAYEADHNTFLVTTTNDSGAGSLRQAIMDSNTAPSPGTSVANDIQFQIPGTGVQTIQPSYVGGGVSLPVISVGATIDGWSQGGPRYNGPPLIQIDGTNAHEATLGSFGFNIQANNTTVRGFAINRFATESGGNGFGIGVFQFGNAPSNIWIYGNYIGTDPTGMIAEPNGQGGIAVGSGPFNVLIGTNADGFNDAAERNIISGNGPFEGVIIQGNNNTVAGNYIGLAADGTPLGNQASGIVLAGNNNVVGGTSAAARNIISANTTDGILVEGTTNSVVGNYVGVGPDGTSARANGNGIHILSAANNTIGGNVPALRNVISGNLGWDILMDGGAPSNLVEGNYIGVSADGTAAVGSILHAAVTLNGNNNTIGGTISGAGNVIAAPGGINVGVNAGVTGTLIAGNDIGTNATGTAALGGFGVSITDSANNTIGGTTALARNVISGNAGDGLLIATFPGGPAASGNLVEGNYIGTNAAGTAALANAADGIDVFSNSGAPTVASNTIGGSVAGAANVISGNNADGVALSGNGTQTNLLAGNFIGTTADGLAVLSNSQFGVHIFGGANGNAVGDGNAFLPHANVISGNKLAQIEMDGGGTTLNIVAGNFIGPDKTGAAPLPQKLGNGVVITGGADKNYIGADEFTQTVQPSTRRNIISANQFNGIDISGSATTGNVVGGNYIGLDLGGAVTLPNALEGVLIEQGASGNRVGTDSNGVDDNEEGNVISGNSDTGVLISGAATTANLVAGNLLGTDATGMLNRGNIFDGITISGASNNTIGGTAAGAGNVVGGNQQAGIVLGGPNNVVQGNIVGLNKTASAPIGNGFNGAGTGIVIDHGANNLVGGAGAARNIVSGNAFAGIGALFADSTGNTILGNWVGLLGDGVTAASNGFVGIDLIAGANNNTIGGNVSSGNVVGVDIGTSNNLVQSNLIGTNAAGSSAVPNTQYGVLLDSGAGNNTIGGTNALTRNVISGNTLDGVHIQDAPTAGNLIIGNFIGTNPAGTAPLGSQANGVFITGGAHDNHIGAPTAAPGTGAGNVISGNTGNGIWLDTTAGDHTTVQGNIIGLFSAGTTLLGGQTNGILINWGFGHLIGGVVPGAGNIISGNSNGIVLSTSGSAFGTIIQGNYIGTDITGTLKKGNISTGVSIGNSPGTQLGGAAPGAGNVISGNAAAGVTIETGPGLSLVQGNFIGTDKNGNAPIPNAIGIVVTSNGNTIGGTQAGAGNLISGNMNDGIEIKGASASTNIIAGNLIGTNSTGSTALPNTDGVHIELGATANTIGGSLAAARNLISGNAHDGVEISDPQTNLNVVAGNFIGTDINGFKALGNSNNAVAIFNGAQFNRIGTISNPAERNIISATLTFNGVAILGSGTNFNVLAGNYIGTDVTGTVALPNAVDGIIVSQGAQFNRIGADGNPLTASAERNIISGNAVDGIAIADPGTNANIVGGNFIGTDASGAKALGNARNAVLIFNGAQANIIGSNGDPQIDVARRNVISGNLFDGVDIADPGTNQNVVAGNYIGVDVTGAVALGNKNNAVAIFNGAQSNRIGVNAADLDVAAERNVISATHAFNGVAIFGANTNANVVAGNYIGTDALGTTAFGNKNDGVFIGSGASSNTIGGNIAGTRNVISGNSRDGIEITGSGTNNNWVAGNFIGTNAGGTAAILTSYVGSVHGVNITAGAQGNIIGTNSDGVNDAAERNVISGNPDWGVVISDPGTSANIVAGNYIGTDVSGTGAIGNHSGVLIQAGATTNSIGGKVAGSGNVISGNTVAGLTIDSPNGNTSGNIVQGNLIGTDVTGSVALSNLYGVAISGAGNIIGGIAAGSAASVPVGVGSVAGLFNAYPGNLISGNAGNGIQIGGSQATGNVVEGNFIGTNLNGNAVLANSGNGVLISSGASNNTIGGSATGAGNLISGNTHDGVELTGNSNVAEGNYIGTDESGNTLIRGTVAWYKGEGNANDALGNNNGTIHGGVTFVPGEVGQAFNFDGTSGTVQVANAGAFEPAYGVTLEAWVKSTSAQVQPFQYILAKGADSTFAASYALYTGLGGGLDFYVYDGSHTLAGIVHAPAVGAAIWDGNWHHVAGTYDGAAVRLYVDGAQIGSGTPATFRIGYNLSTSNDLFIGGYKGPATFLFNGSVDEPAIYNRTLTAAEISQIFKAGSAGKPNVLGNRGNGVLITGGAQNNTVGGTVAGARNVISGQFNSVMAGVKIGADNDTTTTGNFVAGNYIGTDASGTRAEGSFYGVWVEAPNNTVGGTTTLARNLISGNVQTGVLIDGTTTTPVTGNLVEGNFIGTDPSGTTAVGNDIGVETAMSSNNTVGGLTATPGTGAGNVISGNTGPLYGAALYVTGSGDSFAGNLLGTNAAGNAAVGNAFGALVYGANNTIGGLSTQARNIVSGNVNGFDFPRISTATGNVVANNYIGTTLAGDKALGNTSVDIALNASGNTIGLPGAGNVISGSGSNGSLYAVYGGGDHTLFQGNYVGLNAAGTAALPGGAAVLLQSSGSVTIGGTAAGAGNVFAGGGTDNGSGGVVPGTSTASVELLDNNHALVQGNLFGTDATGAVGLGGDGDLALVETSSSTIGGTAAGAANVISSSRYYGLDLGGFQTTGNLIQGNKIGTNLAGSAALPNGQYGIYVNEEASGNTIDRNLISGNVSHGVFIDGTTQSAPDGNVVWFKADGDASNAGNFFAGLVATINGGVTFGPGKSGQAFQFHNNPAESVVVADSNQYLRATAVSIEAWINLNSIPATSNTPGYAIADYATTGGSENYGLYVDNSGGTPGLVFEWFTASGFTDLLVPVPGLTLGVYHHVAATADGSQVNFYLDGALVGTKPMASPLTPTAGSLQIGAAAPFANAFDGRIDDLAVYNRALTAAEIQRIFNAGGGSKDGSQTSSNILTGNLIGTNAAGNAILANGADGVFINSSFNNTIGGATAAARNIISGNTSNGVDIAGLYATGNILAGNYIGTDQSGQKPLGNASRGILVQSPAANNTVGGPTAASRNVISGNHSSGVLLTGPSNTVENNYVGTDATGLLALGNVGSVNNGAITVQNDGNAVLDNLVAGNTGVGILFYNATTGLSNVLGSPIKGNTIGLGADGSTALGNGNYGIYLALNSRNVTIGGNTAADRNVISASGGFGILTDAGATGLVIQGNYVGTDATGSLARPNPAGIYLTDANTIVRNNLISGNGDPNTGNGSDLAIVSTATGAIVQGNIIGLNATGTTALGSFGIGVDLAGASGALIGGASAALRNVISANNHYGVLLEQGSTANLIQGNYIGTDAAGTTAFGNLGNGIGIVGGSTGNTIGGAAAGAGNVISGNNAAGIFITDPGTSNNWIAGNLIGTDKTGTVKIGGNNGGGVVIRNGAANNLIGVDITSANPSAGRNVISGNNRDGISIFDVGTNNNHVAGNFIGVDATGETAMGNLLSGVAIDLGASSNVVGSLTGNSLERNVIAAGTWGVYVRGHFNTIAGNYIGTDANGGTAFGNGKGVLILDSQNTVGGTVAGAGNVISGNTGNGLEIGGAAASANSVTGNIIGMDKSGAVVVPNGTSAFTFAGVHIINALANTIGGTAPGAGNLISGNHIYGVHIEGVGSTLNVVAGNEIGTDRSGTHAFANLSDGILLDAGASSNSIGGAAAGARNLISGNGGRGITINSATSSSNVIAGNYIGTNAAGTAALGNAIQGIVLDATSANTIGGSVPGAGNVISGSGNDGVDLNDNTHNDVIQGNIIGLNASGTAALPNGQYGLALFGSQNDLIGTNADGVNDTLERNLISGNANAGILLAGSGNLVAGNYLGTDTTGTLAIGNGNGGIYMAGAVNNTVGGTVMAARNLISGNSASWGVLINYGSSSGNLVEGNFIGTNVSGTGALGNYYGVNIAGGVNNTIGGTATGAANIIAFNSHAGVLVTTSPIIGPGGTGNAIRGNSIYANGALGIDLGGSGTPVLNDSQGHVGPNNFQDFPVLTSAIPSSMGEVIGTMTGTANASYTIDFYANTAKDPSGYGQGQRYLGFATVVLSAGGTASFDLHLNAAINSTDFITATATDAAGNTSEFGLDVQPSPGTPPAVSINGPATVLDTVNTPLNLTAAVTDNVPGDIPTLLWSTTLNGQPFAFPATTVTNEPVFNFIPPVVGTYLVTLTVDDHHGGVTSASVTVLVGLVNPVVQIQGIPISAVVAQPIPMLTAQASEPASAVAAGKVSTNPSFSYSWSVIKDRQPVALDVGTITNQQTFSFAPKTIGVYEVQVLVTDSNNGIGFSSAYIVIINGNPGAKILVGPGTSNVPEGTKIHLGNQVTDLSLAGPFQYHWTVLKDGNPFIDTGNIAANNYTFVAPEEGTYVAGLTVTDSQNRTGTAAPTVISVVEATPTLTITAPGNIPPPTSVSAGTAVTLNGAAADSGSADVYPLSWSVSSLNGVANPTSGTGASFKFTPTTAGQYMVTLSTVEDGITTSNSILINATQVVRTLQPPTTANATEGQATQVTVNVASPPAGVTFAFSWKVQFGNNLVTGTSVDATSQSTFTFANPAAAGAYNLTVTATGSDGSTASLTTKFVVANAPPTVTINVPSGAFVEGNAINLTSTVTDPGNAPGTASDIAGYAWTVTGPDGFSQSGGGTTLSFTPNEVTSAATPYTVTLKVTDAEGAATTATQSIQVAHVQPVPTIQTTSKTQVVGGAVTTIGLIVNVPDPGNDDVFTFTITATGATASTSGGTGGNQPGFQNNQFGFTLSNVTASINVTVTVTDDEGGNQSASLPITVAAPNTSQAITVPANATEVLAFALGNDILDASSLGTGTKVVFSAVGTHNTFKGGAGVNIFQGDSGSNMMIGGSGSNMFFGTNLDTLQGGTGSNLFSPLPAGISSGDPGPTFGNDTLLGGGSASAITVLAGPNPNNALSFAMMPVGVTVDLNKSGSVANPLAQTLDAGQDQLFLGGNIQVLMGSGQADQLFAAPNSSVFGGGGNDTLQALNISNAGLFGGGGNASLGATNSTSITLFGGSGNSTLSSSGGTSISLFGGGGNDLLTSTGGTSITLFGGGGSTTLSATGGSSVSLFGGAGSSTLSSSGGTSVTLFGGGGNDLLTSTGGTSITLFGGSGNTTLSATGGSSVSLFGGSGNSTLSSSGGTSITLFGGAGNDSLSQTGGTSVTLFGGGGGNSTLSSSGGSSITLFGGSGNSTLSATGGTSVSLFGGAGNATLSSSGGTSITLFGGAGNSTLSSTGGTSVSLFGGLGSNVLSSTDGTSILLFGGTGNSTLSSSGGTTITLFGGGANDTLSATGGTSITLFGGGGNDLLTTTGGTSVTLFGGGGNSTLTSSGGTSISLFGGTGTDSLSATGGTSVSLFGGSGNSTLSSSGGTTITLFGGGGNDTLSSTGGTSITLFGGAGSDSLSQTGGTSVTLFGGGGSSTLTSSGGSSISLFGGSGNASLSATGGTSVTLFGGGGNSTLSSSGGTTITLFGGSGSDTLSQTGGTSITLFGGSGNNDSITSTGGTSITLFGGSGTGDSLRSSNDTSVTLFGGSGGADSLSASGGTSITLFGGSGNQDSLSSTGGTSVTLFGGTGNQDSLSSSGGTSVTLFGGQGTGDTLSTTGGATITLFGGSGSNDSLSSSGGTSITLYGGSGGHDVVSSTDGSSITLFGGLGSNDSLSSSGGTSISLFGGSGNPTVTSSNGTSITLFGGSNNDTLSATGGTSITLFGGAGNNDSLSSSGGTSITLYGGSGSASLVSSGGSTITLFGGGSNSDTLSSINGLSITLFGGAGNNDSLSSSGDTSVTLFGGAGAGDTLTSTGGTTISLFGGSGSDTLSATGGTSVTLFSGTGSDSLSTSGGTSVSLFGGSGDDTLTSSSGAAVGQFGEDGNNLYNVFATAANPINVVLNDLNTFGADLGLIDGQTNGTNTIAFPGVANGITLNLSITSTGSSQTLTSQSVTSYITLSLVGLFQGVIGTPFADSITGNSANDSIVGGGGNDTLTAGSGNTTLVAGSGNVSLVGGAGNDTFQFAGNSFGSDVVNQPTPLPAVLPNHALDFSKTSGPININIASAAQQTAFASPPAGTALNLTLNSPQTITTVIGSPSGNDTITGNTRNDSVYPGGGNDSLVGGGGNDTYFFGPKVGNDTVNAGASKDMLNYQAALEPLTIDLNKTTQTIMQDPATLTLTNPNAVTGVVGTPYPDTITGNNNNLRLIGGGGEDSITSGNGNDLIESNIIQVVLLDFDSQTLPQRGDHIYTAAERSAILGTLQSDYAAFNYTFTLDPVQAQQLTQPTGGQYMTLFFNKPPSGGKSDNLDWRHLTLGATASIDVNPLIGTGGNEVTPTLLGANNQAIDTYVTLSAEIAAHELGHLSAGLRHGDAFGPIGTGMYAGIDTSKLYPQLTAPLAATNAPETPEHIMSSPDSTGVTLTQSASGTFFGEREDIKLAFVDTGTTINSSSLAHNSLATAQALGVLPGLFVPNTIMNPSDRDYGKTLAVRAIDVVGALVPNPNDPQHRATDDYYSFTGNAGDIVNIQAISSALTRNTKPIDTVVYLFDSNGALLTYSDDEFETKDSWIVDYQLPGTLGTSSTYYVKVDSYTPDGIVDFNVGNYDLFMYSFTVPTASTTSLGSGDTIVAGSGMDTIIASSGNDVVQFPSGMHAPALTLGTITGPAVTLPNQSITLSDTLTFFPTNKRHTAVFNWGDGTSAGLVAESNGLGTVTGIHTYTVPGVYLVSLTVTQSDNSSISATTNFVVTVGDSVYVLSPTASGALTISGTSSIKILGPVDVDSKSSSAILATGSASITAQQINVVGGVSESSTATLSPAPHTSAAAVADPLAGLPGPVAGASLGSVNLTNSNKLTINPGTYSQISVSGMAVLTMNPGIYVIEGGGFTVSNGGSVSGNGVLIFNAGSNYPNSGTTGATFGGITLSGAGTFNVTAASSGAYAGVVIYQARNNTRALSIGNSAMAGIRGIVYAPYALLTLSGSSTTKASLVVGTLNLSGSVALTQMAQGSDGGDIATIADTLLAGNLNVYVDPSSSFSADQLARIQDVINTWDALLAPYNVVIAEVSDPTQANLVLDAATTSPCGGMAQGVLGCFDPANSVITIIQGWNWYTGADPTQIGTAQYDFSTTVTHEFGHALGLGGVTDPNSPMNETLPTGVAHRSVSKQDLNIPDAPLGVDPLTATGFQTQTPASNAEPAQQMPVKQTGRPPSAIPPVELLVRLAQPAMLQQPAAPVPTSAETAFFTSANLQIMGSSSVPRTAVTELFVGLPYDSGDGEPEDRAAWDDFWLDFGDDSSTVAPVPKFDGTTRTTSGHSPPAPEADAYQEIDDGKDSIESASTGLVDEGGWLEYMLANGGTANQTASDQYFADLGCDSPEDGSSGDDVDGD